MGIYIRFDWAMKRLLRNKANHAVLEGLMTSLLGRKYTILRFLESESNQESELDKFNRVDILAESEEGELAIVEIQNNRELTYFHRMLYGVSKVITDYIELGNDYVYHGKTFFKGLHDENDILKLSVRQNGRFFGLASKDILQRKETGDLFPEYYVLRVNDFDKVATTPLDEWMEFLKTGKIARESTAPGLSEARECLRIDSLSASERSAYIRHMEALRYQRSVLDTSHDDGYVEGREEGRAEGLKEGRQEGIAQRNIEIAKSMLSLNLPIVQIVQVTGLAEDKIKELTR